VPKLSRIQFSTVLVSSGPPDDNLREQTTVEAFWNFQFAQNLAFTPSIKHLVDPALNPEADQI
jgi:hypothetical protein